MKSLGCNWFQVCESQHSLLLEFIQRCSTNVGGIQVRLQTLSCFQASICFKELSSQIWGETGRPPAGHSGPYRLSAEKLQ